jgi:hypothetical protein
MCGLRLQQAAALARARKCPKAKHPTTKIGKIAWCCEKSSGFGLFCLFAIFSLEKQIQLKDKVFLKKEKKL